MELEEGSPAVVDTCSQDQTDELTEHVNPTETATPAAATAPIKPPRARGRHAKDPLGISVHFKCQRVEDMELKLREYLDNPTGEAEHTTLEFSFPITAAFMVPKREPIGTQAQTPHKRTPYTYSTFSKTAVSVIDALHTIQDPSERALTQRAISKALVESVQRADGYKYSFHNHWLSREDQASRFSYYCNDSSLNKGRAANAGAAKLRDNVKIRKPVYECQGLLSIKFSITKMSLELHYKHVPLHPSYEERAPRPRKESKRRRLLEIFNPELLPTRASGKRGKSKAEPRFKDKASKKRRATEPVPQTNTASGPDPVDEQSLQPLFDFLGSAGRIELQPSPEAVPDQPTSLLAAESTQAPDNGAVADAESTGRASSKQPKEKPTPYPGMMAGFMSGESITWGSKKAIRAPRQAKRSKRTSAPAPNAASPPSSQTTSPSTTVPAPSSELDALKAQLQAAEQKIRDLEAEKTRSNTSISWSIPSRPDYSQPYYPPSQAQPPHHFPYPPPQWHYPPPPGPLPPGSPPGHQYHGPPIASSVPAPAYGFVGGRPAAPDSQPANIAQTNVRWQASKNVSTASASLRGSAVDVGAAPRESATPG